MSGIEIYQIMLDTLTAFGTVGAVCLSLWLVLRKQPRFAVRKIEMMTEHQERSKEHFLVISLENFLDAKMHVFSISVNSVSTDKKKEGLIGGGLVLPLKNAFIPEKSIYNIRQPIASDWEAGTFSKAKQITCTVSTSFGDKEVEFPKQWRDRLCEAIEQPKMEAVP